MATLTEKELLGQVWQAQGPVVNGPRGQGAEPNRLGTVLRAPYMEEHLRPHASIAATAPEALSLLLQAEKLPTCFACGEARATHATDCKLVAVLTKAKVWP